MSIKTLLEAAEYVANVETTKEQPITMSDQQQTISSPSGKVRTPSTDGTLQHWRKRAVAQSVKELSKTSTDEINDKQDNGAILNGVNHESSTTLNGDVKSFPEPAHDTVTDYKNVFKDSKSPDKNHSASDNELVSNHVKSQNHALSPEKLKPKPTQTNTTSDGELSSLNTYQSKLYSGSPIHPLPKSSNNSSPVSPAHQQSSEKRSQPSRKDLMTQYRNSVSGDEVLKRKSQLEAETREAHNKLEKTRRKHLKERFDELKSSVPNLGTKVSHLTILREALKYVQFLERKNRRLGEEHSALETERTEKQRRIESLKQRLVKFMKPEDIDAIINKANQRGTIPRSEETSISRQQMTRHTNNRVYSHGPQSNRFLNQLIDKTVSNSLPNTNQQRATVAPLTHWAGTNNVLQATPNVSVLPQLSSTLNQMWQNASDIRRVCTMLPAPQMMSSAEVLRKPPSVSGVQRPTGPGDNSPMTHFRPISAASQTVSNAKSYTGWNMPPGGMTNFMRGCPNPLKIVVKPVGSAKQQARVMKPLPTPTTSNNQNAIQTTASERAKQSELVYRPHSSITPPPPSNITPYFPRFSVGSGGSPPLTTVLPRNADVKQKSNTEDQEKPSFSKSGFKPWRSLSDCDNDKTDHARKFHASAAKRKSDGGLSDSSSSKISKVHPGGLHRHSIEGSPPITSPSSESSKQSTTNHLPQATVKGTQGLMIPRTIPCLPVAPVMFPTFVNQAKPVTRVCYSTLSSTKPAVPDSPAKLAKEPDTSKESSSAMNPSQVQQNSSSVSNASLPNAASLPVKSMPTNMFTNVMPVMGYSMTPRVPPQAHVMNRTASSVAPNNAVVSTVATPAVSNTTNGPQGMSIAMKPAQMPQFQCFIPMGFPGVMQGMQGSNGSQMAFQPTMGGFIPVMPQGQGWGFMMPQNMMFASNNNTNFSAPENSQSVESVSSSATVKPSITSSDCTGNNNPVTKDPDTASSAQPMSQVSTPMIQPQQSVQSRQLQPVQAQQFQMMPTGFQTPNQFMVPVAAAPQTGGFVFGGAPTMMQSPQGGTIGYQMPMNIIGYPMQVQPPSFQFSPMPQPNVNMMQRGFSFGFTGSVPTGVMAVGDYMERNEGFSGTSTSITSNKSTQNVISES